MFVERILDYICILLALFIVLPLHEFAHAFVAVKSGDQTPRLYGRYTLNPLAHFDIFGLIMFVLARFGWAKPVPVNPDNFRHRTLDSFLVSSAGVIVNYITSFLIFPLYVLVYTYVPEFGYFTYVLRTTLLYAFSFGLVFCVFNLLPIYPLDGFRVIDCFIKRRGKFYYNYKRYGIFVLYAFLLLSIIADYTNVPQLDILGNLLSFVVNYIQIPIIEFWGLIF